MENTILDEDAGIINLIENNNFVVIKMLFETNRLTVDMFQKCIIKKFKDIDPKIPFYFISNLVCLIDSMLTDKIVINILLNCIITCNRQMNENLIPLIKKLINMSGEILLKHVPHLPDELFLEYLEHYNIEINYDFLYKSICHYNDMSSRAIERWNTMNLDIEELFEQICTLATATVVRSMTRALQMLIEKAYENFISEKLLLHVCIRCRNAVPDVLLLIKHIFSKEISFLIYLLSYDSTNIYQYLHPDIIKHDINFIRKKCPTNFNIINFWKADNNYYNEMINIAIDIVAEL